MDIPTIKAQIRSILLSLGKTATEQEFRKAYYEIEGVSFNEVLRQLKIDFHNLFLRIPDVAKIVYAYNQVFIQRVSSQTTAHMENLTVNKYSKNFRGPKLVSKSGAIRGRPMTTPLSVQAPVYMPYPIQTFPVRKVPPYQQNRLGYQQRQAQNNFNMKVSVGTNNSNRNTQSYYSNNASTSYTKPPVSAGINSSNFNFGNVTNTSTKNDLSTKDPPKAPEVPKTSSIASNSDALTKTIRMPPTSTDISSISSIADSESTRIADDFEDAISVNGSSSVKSDYKSAKDETLTTPPKAVPPKVAPMASSTKSRPPVTSLLKSKEVKESSNVEELADKVGTLKLNGTESCGNAVMVKNRLRSMRIFREALNAINANQESSSQCTESAIEKTDLITLPDPIQNEVEVFFFMKIIDVASPAKFAFQFSFESLKTLSNKMNEFYNNLRDVDKYLVKDLIIDNIVAIRRKDLWYRGQIKSFDEANANIQFVDSLKIQPHKVLRRNIYHLHQKFTTESPKSAIGKLHGLKPINGEWSMLSTANLDSVIDKLMLATVKCIDNGIYSLSVIAETSKFTRLNDIWVEKDLAAIELEDFATEAVFRSLV